MPLASIVRPPSTFFATLPLAIQMSLMTPSTPFFGS
jgi:hypothetical protein